MERKIAIIGLGYVGLPVAVALAKTASVIGFDIDEVRVEALQRGIDVTNELSTLQLQSSSVEYTSDVRALKAVDFYIVTVPTPLDATNKPDLQYLTKASAMIGEILKRGDIVVFESTVFPGAVEEVCLPLLEHHSGLISGKDFGLGYSPERINTGDTVHTLETVTKIISASDEQTLAVMKAVYGKVVRTLHEASSIKVAEAAKVIENTQRDLNIALMNELAIIFKYIGIDTQEVIESAKTKWNFSAFEPGLVGGHCIGVDPYYLTYKAKQLGYRPEVILAGRRINDGMGRYIAAQTVKKLILKKMQIMGAKIAVLGLTFKENCRDLRNSKVHDIIEELRSFGVEVIVHDPIADPVEAKKNYGVTLTEWNAIESQDALIVCVAHEAYRRLSPKDYVDKLTKHRLIVDVKSILDRRVFQELGVDIWRL